MKLKKLVSDTLKFWYIYLIAFVLLEILNYGVLSLFIPHVVCFWLSSFFIVLICIYLYFLFTVIYDTVVSFLEIKEQELYRTLDTVKNHIEELDNKNKQLSKELVNSLCANIKSGNDEVVKAVREDIKCNKENIVGSIFDNSNEIKKVLDNKIGLLLETQSKEADKFLNNYKTGVSDITELIKTRVDMSAEQNKSQTDNLLSNLKNLISKNVVDMISRFEEETSKTLESINDIHRDVEEKVNESRADIITAIENLEEKSLVEHAERIKTAENIIEMNSTIVENQKCISDKVHSKFSEHEELLSKVRETLVKSIEDSTTKEITALNDTKEKITLGLENVVKTQTLQAEHFDVSLENKSKEIIRLTTDGVDQSIKTYASKINSSYIEFIKAFDDNSTKIENRAVELHSETTKLINLALDNIDAGAEKNERYINLLNSQLTEILKKQKNGVSDLLKEIEENKCQIEEAASKLNKYIGIQETQGGELEGIIENYIKPLTDYYTNCFNKVESIQAEVLSISHAIRIINNIYSVLQEREKDGDSGNNDSDKIEEYKDEESGAIVRNHYKRKKLWLSEMIADGKKQYEVHYGNDGKALKSYSYNKIGEVISEIEFYKNGQVKFRKETCVKNGKKETILSRFDEKGNKIK